jgi:hypothetical protein
VGCFIAIFFFAQLNDRLSLPIMKAMAALKNVRIFSVLLVKLFPVSQQIENTKNDTIAKHINAFWGEVKQGVDC